MYQRPAGLLGNSIFLDMCVSVRVRLWAAAEADITVTDIVTEPTQSQPLTNLNPNLHTHSILFMQLYQ